jgi:hypothetical protein
MLETKLTEARYSSLFEKEIGGYGGDEEIQNLFGRNLLLHPP